MKDEVLILTIILTILLSIPLVVSSSYAENLYVTPDGLGTDCTLENPCGSIQEAVDRASSHDYIHVGSGMYYENVTIANDKHGLTITGEGAHSTILVSAGGISPPKEAPANVSADIILDIFAPHVTIEGIGIRHPQGIAEKRDIGVFVRPPATDVTLQNLRIERLRSGVDQAALEPTLPGSRGILVFRAQGTAIQNSLFQGNYEDHIHLPTSNTLVEYNIIIDATRLGIAVIQETPTSDSILNTIRSNKVFNSGSDGIQIQGDKNIIEANTVRSSGGAGIKLCGVCPEADSECVDCVAPGHNADASRNKVHANIFDYNTMGTIMDKGSHNFIYFNQLVNLWGCILCHRFKEKFVQLEGNVLMGAVRIMENGELTAPSLDNTPDDTELLNTEGIPLRDVETLVLDDEGTRISGAINHQISGDLGTRRATTRGLVASGMYTPITVGQWRKAHATGTVKVTDEGSSTVTLKFMELIPQSLYTIWQFNMGEEKTDGPFGGIPNVFTTDAHGNAEFVRHLPYDLFGVISHLVVVYHSDHRIYGGIPSLSSGGLIHHGHLRIDFITED